MKEPRQEVGNTGRGPGAGRTIAAFALGATAGSIIALLYAPASGTVTRRRIAMKVQGLQRVAGRKLGQTTRLLARKAELLREVAAERFNGARHWVTAHVANGHGKRPLRRRPVHQA